MNVQLLAFACSFKQNLLLFIFSWFNFDLPHDNKDVMMTCQATVCLFVVNWLTINLFKDQVHYAELNDKTVSWVYETNESYMLMTENRSALLDWFIYWKKIQQKQKKKSLNNRIK